MLSACSLGSTGSSHQRPLISSINPCHISPCKASNVPGHHSLNGHYHLMMLVLPWVEVGFIQHVLHAKKFGMLEDGQVRAYPGIYLPGCLSSCPFPPSSYIILIYSYCFFLCSPGSFSDWFKVLTSCWTRILMKIGRNGEAPARNKKNMSNMAANFPQPCLMQLLVKEGYDLQFTSSNKHHHCVTVDVMKPHKSPCPLALD